MNSYNPFGQVRAAARAARRAGFQILEALPAFDRVMDADAEFFSRHRERSYRARVAETVELEVTGLNVLTPPDGRLWFAVVHQVAPWMRQRQLTDLSADTDCDTGEAHARALWMQGEPLGTPFHYLSAVAAAGLSAGGCSQASSAAAKQVARDLLRLRLRVVPGALWMGRPLVVGLGEAVNGVWRFEKPEPTVACLQMASLMEGLAERCGLILDGRVTSPPFDVDCFVPGTQAPRVIQ